jgi:hypothetical protein
MGEGSSLDVKSALATEDIAKDGMSKAAACHRGDESGYADESGA